MERIVSLKIFAKHAQICHYLPCLEKESVNPNVGKKSVNS